MKKISFKKISIYALRILLVVFGGYYLFMFLAPIVGHIVNIGNIVGTAMAGCAIIVGAFFNQIVKLCKRIEKNRRGKVFLTSSLTLLFVGLFAFTASLISVISYSDTNAENEDTLIVLGCAVWGENPSYMLRARANYASKYLEEHPSAVAVLSGGQGESENISEAECMRRILVENGIDESRLYLEDRSTNTEENIKFSKEIIEENGLSNNIAIVTSDYHLRRATMIAKRYGIDARRIAARSGKYSIPTFYVRDTLGVMKEYVFG